MARRSCDTDFTILQEALGLSSSSQLHPQNSKEDELKTQGWETYHCTLVTPLYGGGVEAGKIDLQMPIRATEIRGHLRFWWRLLYGNSEDSKEIFKRECEIWGGIGKEGATKSKVEIRISNITGTSENRFKSVFEYWKAKDDDGNEKYKGPDHKYGNEYALFPARGSLEDDRSDIKELPHRVLEANVVKFCLQINLEKKSLIPLNNEQKEQVITALRWWASFGGIGARTRRGLGAIKVDELDPVTREEVSDRNGRLEVCALTSNLSNQRYTDNKFAEKAWNHSVDRLKAFRQEPNIGRTKSSQKKIPGGESRWPEPDSIRNISGYIYKNNEPDKDRSPNNTKQNSFPRAAFGLPIIFHFKDSNSRQPKNRNFDPQDHALEPKDQDKERMASPVIVRPYWDGEWKACALLIPGWERALAQPLEFRSEKDLLKNNQSKEYKNSPNHWNNTTDSEKDTISQRMTKISATKDPLTAFLDFFEEGK